MDQAETQPWLPSSTELLLAWGEVEKKESELRQREEELDAQERVGFAREVATAAS